MHHHQVLMSDEELERRIEAVAGTQFVVIEIFIELAAETFFD
jgi:hypothetical protein